ncbi:siderophore-interacting protein [Geodermatophilus poikilotrophus]|uniref:NADPH-dependent ferric siderophore reductase, contains FAD-binding and SIP domains n=1 Tax=Geodermatophilus poikilotrophus TaxID=1333667 RepID=A0A1I0HUF2_9ACTN|nr:siderophore-interacting protein [Geodermatophilus poikilotrophus]SET87872.1 NADPH-dependent ferric siderophore reductase, contains FAD-binding and SIP domains [Geodermatophilus poikilotrophus]
MTLTAQPEVAAAPAWRFFDASVAEVRRLGPSFVRLTLTGPELAGFGAAGCDQRFKLVLPRDDAGLDRLRDRGQDWYPAYCALPEEQRPVIRTYTVRALRPERAELDVDVVLHGVDNGHAGPAASWAAAAVPGDRIVLLGPDRPGAGRPWGVEWAPPPAARTLLLAGDETAVPAVCAILESLGPPGGGPRAVTALLEVPEAGDAMDVALPARATLRWLPRDGAARGSRLVPAVHAALCALGTASTPAAPPEEVDDELLWEVPDPDAASGCYAWLAGEAGVVRTLRRSLVGDLGVPRGSVAFMGYWRQGVAG